MGANQIGYPKLTKFFVGIDEIGSGTSVDESLSIWNRSREAFPSGLVKLGSNITIFGNTRFVVTDREESPDSGIEIGDGTMINYGSFLSGEGGLVIGKNVLIGPSVLILSGGHDIEDGESIYKSRLINKKIEISDESWIGAGAKIIGGVNLGYGAVVGAGSVVTKSVPPFAVVVGVPAKIIKFRSFSKFNFLKKKVIIFKYNFL